MRGPRSRRAAGLRALRFGGRGLARCHLARRLDRRRGRRLCKRDVDEALDDVHRPLDVDVETAQQDEAEANLDEHDRGEREHALPRPSGSMRP